MTLNSVIALTSPNRSVISLNSVAFGTDYVKLVEDTPTLSAVEM